MINPQQIEFARGLTNSQKDKRLTMFPEDIKKFVIESNTEKAVRLDFEGRRTQDIRSMVHAGGQQNTSSSANYGGAATTSVNRVITGNKTMGQQATNSSAALVQVADLA